MQLNETIKKIVKTKLNEALGISKVVSIAVDDIVDKCVNYSDDKLSVFREAPHRPISMKKGIFEYELVPPHIRENGVIEVSFTKYEFDTETEFNEFREEHRSQYIKMLSGKTGTNNTTSKVKITIPIIIVGEEVYYGVYNVIQHELEHAYQRILSGKEFLAKDVNRYNKALKHLQNSTDEYVKMVGRIIYYSPPSEIEGYANGLYGLLKHGKYMTKYIDDVIKNSPYYRIVTKLRIIVNELAQVQDNNEIESSIKNEFDMSIKNVIRLGDNAIHEYIHKMGRIKTLVLQEKGKI